MCPFLQSHLYSCTQATSSGKSTSPAAPQQMDLGIPNLKMKSNKMNSQKNGLNDDMSFAHFFFECHVGCFIVCCLVLSLFCLCLGSNSIITKDYSENIRQAYLTLLSPPKSSSILHCLSFIFQYPQLNRRSPRKISTNVYKYFCNIYIYLL